MARKPRVHVPGGFYHVMLRGNAGQSIFVDDADRRRFCALVAEGVERFGHRLHAYCLMGNHAHLLVCVGRTPLSSIVQNLAFRYARWYNRRTKRVGHLFQGRFRALLIDANNYLLELVRYIHLNPVRSGLVRSPAAWAWSGHRAYLGKVEAQWLDTAFVLSMLSPDKRLARRRYVGLVREGLGETYREELHRGAVDGRILGDQQFLRHALRSDPSTKTRRPALDEVIAHVCRAVGLDESALRTQGRRRDAAKARALVAFVAVETRAATLSQVAGRFGRDISTLSHLVARLRQIASDDTRLAGQLEKLQRGLGAQRLEICKYASLTPR